MALRCGATLGRGSTRFRCYCSSSFFSQLTPEGSGVLTDGGDSVAIGRFAHTLESGAWADVVSGGTGSSEECHDFGTREVCDEALRDEWRACSVIQSVQYEEAPLASNGAFPSMPSRKLAIVGRCTLEWTGRVSRPPG